MALSKEVNFEALSHILEEYIPVPRRQCNRTVKQDLSSNQSGSESEDSSVHSLAANYLAEITNESEEEDAGMELSQNSQGDELKQEIEEQLSGQCPCKKDCFNKVNIEDIYSHVLNLREMAKGEKEMFIMGKLLPKNISAKTRKGDRIRTQYIFHFGSIEICRKSFIICHDLGEVVLRNIISHMEVHGITSRVHGNVGKRPKHALTFEDTNRVVQFIKGYSVKFGLSQPAAPRGRDDTPPILLPAGQTKAFVYEKYVESCNNEDNIRFIGLSSFKDIWIKILPHIKFVNPKEDVCSKCELLWRDITDAITEEEKLNSSTQYNNHLVHAREENDFYKSLISSSKLDENVAHYTFDFAHHVTLPHHARQMGPLYFLNLRKIQWFGVRREDHKDQLNFLIDEGDTPGPDGTSVHGPDAVISMIDTALLMQGRGENKLHFHADNCPGLKCR